MTGKNRGKFGEDWFDETTIIFCFQIWLGFVLLETLPKGKFETGFQGGLLSEQLYLNYNICHIRLALYAEL